MEKAIQNMVFELFTDEELLLLLRSNSEDPLSDTDPIVLRDVGNPGAYMTYKGYNVQETDSHRIFLTSNYVPTIEDNRKTIIFPRVVNPRLPTSGDVSYMQFDVIFEVWMDCKLWVMSDGRFRWTQILSRLNKIYNK